MGRRGAVALFLTLSSVVTIAGCTAKPTDTPNQSNGPTGSATASSIPSSSNSPAVVTMSPAPGTSGVSPLDPVKISVSNGMLTAVSMTNPEGRAVKGTLAADKLSWHSAEVLGYGKTYTVKATASNPQGEAKVANTTITTVTPSLLTMPYIQTAAGGSVDGATFGVGQVLRIHFDEPIPDRKAAQRAIRITTTPAQLGGFNWQSDQDVYWRTKSYLKSGTKVAVKVAAYGATFGNGLYGQADAAASFKVGAKQISVVDDNELQLRVYRNDKLVRTIPTAMGRHATIKGDNGQDIDLRTNSGPHVVVGGETNIKMSSGTFGVDPKKNPNGYETKVPVGVRISYDGEYVHWADWSIADQGYRDVSHGCLNVSPDNAWWFYNFSQPGDIVDVKNTGRQLQMWNSGWWTVSFAEWVKGSAL